MTLHHAGFAPTIGCDALSPAQAVAPLPAAWECDLRDESLRWSPGVYALFGVPRDMPLVRDRIVALYEDDSRHMLEHLRATAIRDGGSFTFEPWIRRLSGERRRMLLTADVAFENGRPSQLYGLKQDITDL